jgi:hypothetical protein
MAEKQSSMNPTVSEKIVQGWEQYSTSMVINKLKLWSLIVLPVTGYIISKIIIKSMFSLIFGWNHSANFEIVTAHLMTMAFMISVTNELVFMQNREDHVDPKEKAFFVCISYLFLLGNMIGVLT